MEEFGQNTHIEELPDSYDTEEYISMIGEGDINKLDIINLFGKEKLENIQKSLSKATGLAFVTVDFRGEPITEPAYFTEFCNKMRGDSKAIECCKSSDAFGSIQSAVMRVPNVYFCPCGLLEVAIPIIVKGHYLGGFIGGQVQCNDAPENVCRLGNVVSSDKSREMLDEYQNLKDEIQVVSYEKFKDIANLVFLVINQLSENQVSQQVQENQLKRRIHKMQTLNQKYIQENRKKDHELKKLKAKFDPYEILDNVTSLLNLTVIEEAPVTNEMLVLFIDYLKYMYTEKDTFVPVAGELEHAEQYLEFQKKRYGDKLEYSIQVPQSMHLYKIPSHVLLPFIKNAFYNGVMLKKGGGKITVTGAIQNGNVILEIVDTGTGLTEEELAIKFETYKEKHPGHYIELGMEYAREKMKRLFGEEFDIIIEEYKNKGRKCVLFWPEHLEKRV